MTKVAKHTVTKTPMNYKGVDGFKLTCDCSTHEGWGNAAFVPFDVRENRIHGWVILANDPAKMIREFQASKGVFALDGE